MIPCYSQFSPNDSMKLWIQSEWFRRAFKRAGFRMIRKQISHSREIARNYFIIIIYYYIETSFILLPLIVRWCGTFVHSYQKRNIVFAKVGSLWLVITGDLYCIYLICFRIKYDKRGFTVLASGHRLGRQYRRSHARNERRLWTAKADVQREHQQRKQHRHNLQHYNSHER